jgi:hypothetical protein
MEVTAKENRGGVGLVDEWNGLFFWCLILLHLLSERQIKNLTLKFLCYLDVVTVEHWVIAIIAVHVAKVCFIFNKLACKQKRSCNLVFFPGAYVPLSLGPNTLAKDIKSYFSSFSLKKDQLSCGFLWTKSSVTSPHRPENWQSWLGRAPN